MKIPQAILIGHSMGALVVMALAARAVSTYEFKVKIII